MNRALAQGIVRALGVTGVPRDRLRAVQGFNAADWQRTLAWLDDSALGLYLLDAVERAGAGGPGGTLPAAIRTRLAQNLESNRLRLAAMKGEFRALNWHLDAAGAEYAVLKGFALVPDYCPDAALRSQYDYDYLVSPRTAASAEAALENLGYCRKVQSPGHEPEGVSLMAPRPLGPPAADGGFYSASLARGVELHTKLWEYDADGVRVETPPDVLERRQPAAWEGLSFPALDGTDALLFQVLHAFHHLLDHWCRLSCFLEIARFLDRRHADSDFWERFRARVQPLGYAPEVTGLVLAMAGSLFDAPLPREVSRWAAPPPAVSLWVQHYGLDWALAPFPGSKLSLFVHAAFVEDAHTWRRIRRARLFPWHRPAQVVGAGDPAVSPVAAWKSRAEQWRFVLGRARFHFGALCEYGRHLRRWNRMVRAGGR
jgi:hypothetical protein